MLTTSFDAAINKARLLKDLPLPRLRRRIRERAGLSQSDLARAMGVKPQAVSRWEMGITTPTGERLLAYVRLLERLQEEVA